MYLNSSLRMRFIKDIGEVGKGQGGRFQDNKFGGRGQQKAQNELKVKGSEVEK